MSLALIERPSPNFDERDRAVEFVVLHYTGMQSAEIALARLTDPAPRAGSFPGPWQPTDADPETALPRVSTHYVVAEDGRIFRLVPEEKRAWHAGRASWLGVQDVNSAAIGIEIVNGGHDFGLPDFPDVQIDAVIALVKDILARNKLPARAVIAHSDIAPARKLDPGERFPWDRLAAAHAAVVPRAAAQGAPRLKSGDKGEDVLKLQADLKTFGYGIEKTGRFDAQTELVVAAFQRRFRQSRVDGIADEETRVRLASLLAEHG